MLDRSLLGAITLAAALCATTAPTWGWDDAKYPDLKGQWRAIGGPGRFDISKPAGRGQQAPLTAEYQALFEANLVDQANGGQGTTPTYKCISPGMPRVTNGYGEIEFVVTPETTYVLVDHIQDDRRIYTDGRMAASSSRRCSATPSVTGSMRRIGPLRHARGRDPRFRGPFLTPASFRCTGRRDRGQSGFSRQGRLNVAHDEVTVYDHPDATLTVTKTPPRPQAQPNWTEEYCEDNNHVSIGQDDYCRAPTGC